MPDPAPISVLYVDDELSLHEVTGRFLEIMGGFSVKCATSGAEALEMIGTSRFDAIISDYQMPVMDGIEFLKRVRSQDSITPFILFTGKGREDIVIQAINNGATFYIQKGSDITAQFTELAQKIRLGVDASRVKEELKRNFLALRQREEYYRTVFENTGTAMIVIEDDTTISLVNTECERLLGSTRAEIEGTSWTKFVPDKEREKMLVWHRQRRDSPVSPPQTYESRIIASNGQIRSVHITVTTIPGTKRTVASIIDVTNRVRAQEALRQSEMLHRTIFETSPDTLALTNSNGILSYASPAATSLFGLDSDKDALGTPIFDWIVPEMREQAKKHILEFIRGNGPASLSEYYILLKKDGSRFHAEINSAVLTGADGRPIGMISILRDVTSRISAEAALRRASTKLNLLSSVTRHDILNKLTVLLGYIELARVAKDPAAIENFLKKIDEIAGMLGEQIEFTKDYQDLGVHSPEWQNVSSIVSRASHDIDLGQVNIEDRCGYLELYADPLLVKVVYNLIDNALRHGGQHISTIHFGYSDKGSELVLIVEDDGEGVSINDKERIFTKGFGKNTGFGLFLVREILAITGMCISETGFPGKGARFEIQIPSENYRFRKRT
jgi:PAS domain S-box-containing protein